jgi:hypothetical protein
MYKNQSIVKSVVFLVIKGAFHFDRVFMCREVIPSVRVHRVRLRTFEVLECQSVSLTAPSNSAGWSQRLSQTEVSFLPVRYYLMHSRLLQPSLYQ